MCSRNNSTRSDGPDAEFDASFADDGRVGEAVARISYPRLARSGARLTTSIRAAFLAALLGCEGFQGRLRREQFRVTRHRGGQAFRVALHNRKFWCFLIYTARIRLALRC